MSSTITTDKGISKFVHNAHPILFSHSTQQVYGFWYMSSFTNFFLLICSSQVGLPHP